MSTKLNMSSILPPPPSSHLYPLPLCTSCPPLSPSSPFDKTMHGDSLAISKKPNPPPKYKASQCGKSDPNTASQSDSSKDCTHSKGVNQLGAMSHSEPAPLFFLDVVIEVELFTLLANFLSPAAPILPCFLWSILFPLLVNRVSDNFLLPPESVLITATQIQKETNSCTNTNTVGSTLAP